MTRRLPEYPPLPPKALGAGLLSILLLLAGAAVAAPAFEDVTTPAGIHHAGPTAGASWGDVNGDGWPDLWIGNHRFGAGASTLLINRQDGTFEDASDTVTTDKDADPHGAAWADFDNDGDQDLIVLAGGGAGQGSNPNRLLRNDGGALTDVAAQLGVVSPLGRGRTPVWLDADNDGLLDLLISNKPRPDGRAPTTLFVQQTGRFVPIAPALAFAPAPRSWLDDKLYRLWHGLSFRNPTFGSLNTLEVFAQLADVNDDHRIDLMTYDYPTRVYELSGKAPQDITDDVYLGSENNVADIAAEDFTGDQRFDLYVARARAGTPDIEQSGPRVLRAAFRGSHRKAPYALTFAAASPIEMQIVDPWEVSARLPPVHIGKAGRSPGTLVFDLDPEDPAVAGPAEHEPGTDEVLVEYLPASGLWKVSNWGRPVHLIVRSRSAPITDAKPVGFTTSKGMMADRMLVQGDSGEFVPSTFLESGQERHACTSVAAGDFDNDMDVDVYLVCAEPVSNAPNVLLENLGDGRMREVPGGGGAAGSDLGRGDAVATADYDRDGFLDLFVTNGAGSLPFSDDGPYQLFRNVGNGNHWLEIDLAGTRSNRDGIGAIVELAAGGKSQVREQSGGIHSFSQNGKRLHFGLGPNPKADSITIWWPSGTQQTLSNVPADRILTIREDTGG